MKHYSNQNIDKALQSLNGMKRAEASPFLFGKIMHKLSTQVPEPIYYSGKMILQFAMMLAVIISLNFITLKNHRKMKQPMISDESAIIQVAQEYFETDNLYIY
jgi:hypothetical protein